MVLIHQGLQLPLLILVSWYDTFEELLKYIFAQIKSGAPIVNAKAMWAYPKK